jgi:exodeoxyribonuclease VII small subunit
MTETPNAVGTGTPVEEMSYTEASRELDEIVRFFEQRDVDVDQLVGHLVRATALVEELDKRLRQTRMQVEQLVPRLAAVLADGPTPSPPGGPGRSVDAPEESAGDAAGAEEDLGDADADLEDLDEEDLEEVELAEVEDRYVDIDDGADRDDGDADDGSTPELF